MNNETMVTLASWEGWRMVGSVKGWHAQELRSVAGARRWDNRGWFSNGLAALLYAYDRTMREAGRTSLDAIGLARVADGAARQISADLHAVPEWSMRDIPPGDVDTVALASWHGWRLARDAGGWRVDESRGTRHAPRLHLPTTAAALLYAYDRTMREAGRPVTDIRGLARLVDGSTLDVFQAFPGNRRKISMPRRPLSDLADWASWRAGGSTE